MGYALASPAVWPACRSRWLASRRNWGVIQTNSKYTGTLDQPSAMWRVEEVTVRSTDPSATTQFIASELQPRSASGAMRELGTHLPLPPHVSGGRVLCCDASTRS